MPNLKPDPADRHRLYRDCRDCRAHPERRGPDSSSGSTHYRPDPASVQRYGAGYRYPQAGWIVLHIEGEPYERGYQHGRLLAPEIGRFIPELASYRSRSAPTDAWKDLRLLVDALFLRRFDAEYREEMKGIADGAAAAGATSTAGRSISWTS